MTQVKTKKDICNELNISSPTLANYLNNLWYNDMLKLGYYKRQKILTGPQVKYIYNKLCYIPESKES
jgi:hypothetical protein